MEVGVLMAVAASLGKTAQKLTDQVLMLLGGLLRAW